VSLVLLATGRLHCLFSLLIEEIPVFKSISLIWLKSCLGRKLCLSFYVNWTFWFGLMCLLCCKCWWWLVELKVRIPETPMI